MKPFAFIFALISSPLAYAATDTQTVQSYLNEATQQQLDQDITWRRLMYADSKGQSEVSYAGYFLSAEGKANLKLELQANIKALFQAAEPNQSVRCRFPARSHWLMQRLNIQEQQLPAVACPELEDWIGQIKPYKATLIYATDFMGNPSSMFGHTLLRLDPQDQKQLNLVSYAVNYAATVTEGQSWSFAWNGLTGQYPGEYSLMPYYRKVKEYGDLESRDLWEYELSLSPEETRFLVQHIWEMKHVTFPYYFISDNCAYRLLGLMDLVRPNLNLKAQFNIDAIPIETIRAVEQQGLVADTVYRPALETQLQAQATQHGQALAKKAHQTAFSAPEQMADQLASYTEIERAQILEMAYDDLYLYLTSRKVQGDFAQPRLRQLLVLRSEIQLEKQRKDAARPAVDPTQGHHAKNISFTAGQLQGDAFYELGHRQAYHDLMDPQGGFRTGTQLMFWDGALQYRQNRLKLEYFDFLSVNSYNPITPFKTPLSWGFNFGWQQEAMQDHGQFSEKQQHGVANLNTQAGYSWANNQRTHLCYMQMQMHVQGSQALDQGWRAGAGPALGCQNIWSEKINSLVQVELPYWADQNQWNFRFNSQIQYVLNPQNAIRLNWEYQQQNHLDWNKAAMELIHYF
ncbi:MAG: DUF4105 domain-containing protein [Acinetobacter sp.]